MAEWKTNNLSCVNVWSTLFIMRQHRKTFKKAGDLKMKELLFYNPTLTDPELKFEAEGIADFLDIVFKNTYRAKYEAGVDRDKAFTDITNILIDKEKTMAELAEQVDKDYEF
ncbi:MAG: hypothetical protein JWQ96_1644 [Segetibacter sp.]|nr:hypothetical protein [Segetibacter sp.]